ncbi:L,D-transpeptidase family protein [Marinobacter sp. NP-4(2019)]|uniref:L,D-transpeptidase family protein n=1 Tax=Marinobacter sp. NP-4(2019) TaxID=2488665 RepID=UPI001D188E28|nr:L,D-transpeptidase family protein [Marinobacter sp. NP-4(2019)]
MFLFLFMFAASLLTPFSGALATEMLARAETRMPEDKPSLDHPLSINKVLVRKSERRLYLMDDQEVVRSYRISLGDNPEGHKLYEGDKRTPEGHYQLDWRNADSDFYKSIHISYPNERDQELAEAWGLDPGGSIMIHGLPNDAGDMAFAYTGLDWTNGCIAVTNEEMDEIWSLVSDGTPISILP